jgi:hypothetical protein
MVIGNKIHTHNIQKLGATAQNLVTMASLRQGFVHPCPVIQESSLLFIKKYQGRRERSQVPVEKCFQAPQQGRTDYKYLHRTGKTDCQLQSDLDLV